MARYSSSFVVAFPIENLQAVLVDILEACNFKIIYRTSDYMMASEVPGQIPYAQLVAVEVLIDRTQATEERVRMRIVAKNGELPLHRDNHCSQTFEQVHQAIADNPQWQVLEVSVDST